MDQLHTTKIKKTKISKLLLIFFDNIFKVITGINSKHYIGSHSLFGKQILCLINVTKS